MADFAQNPGTLNVQLVQGDTLSIPLTISGRWETYTWTGTVRPDFGEEPDTSLTIGTATYTTASDDTAFTVSLTSASSDDLETREYVWDLQYQTGSTVRTFLLGKFTVRGDVT